MISEIHVWHGNREGCVGSAVLRKGNSPATAKKHDKNNDNTTPKMKIFKEYTCYTLLHSFISYVYIGWGTANKDNSSWSKHV